MAEPLTQVELNALAALCAKHRLDDPSHLDDHDAREVDLLAYHRDVQLRWEEAVLYSAATKALPRLLDEVRALRALADAARAYRAAEDRTLAVLRFDAAAKWSDETSGYKPEVLDSAMEASGAAQKALDAALAALGGKDDRRE